MTCDVQQADRLADGQSEISNIRVPTQAAAAAVRPAYASFGAAASLLLKCDTAAFIK